MELALEQIPAAHIESIEILVRADTAGSTHGLADYCRENDLRFSVGYELTEPVRAAILHEGAALARQAVAAQRLTPGTGKALQTMVRNAPEPGVAVERSSYIRVEHLAAALAFWHYASESAHWVFGDSLGDPTADEIWEMAKTNPQASPGPRSATSSARNKKAREIDRALTALVDAGRLERGETPTRGRQTGRRLAAHPRRASRLSPREHEMVAGVAVAA